MEFRLLGPVEDRISGALLDLGAPRQRCVFAALAADAGRPVPVDTIVDRVWDDNAPPRVRDTVYVYVGRLRKLLSTAAPAGEPAVLVRRSGGYLLDVHPDCVDLHRFRGTLGLARVPGGPPDRRLALLREALQHWHGTPLADLDTAWVHRMRLSWQRERVEAVTEWADAELRTGNGAVTIGLLGDLLELNPLDEGLAAVLIRALHAAGRTADALDCFRRTRQRVITELGIDPGPQLQQVQAAVLRGEGAQRPSAPADPVPRYQARPGPAQLPRDVTGFAGRAADLAGLHELLPTPARQPAATAVCVLSGTAGVGKTTLAVHFAHQARDRFPDGQLYVNLRGFDPDCNAMTPQEAVRAFLEALDVPPARIPSTAEAQYALYRTLLSGKQMIVLLDNARDAAAVRPLLPGAPGCLVLVTSRTEMVALAATEGARLVPVDVLPDRDAVELLAHRLGADRMRSEGAAVDQLIERCAGLPLALAIAAALAGSRRETPLRHLLSRLGEAGGLELPPARGAGPEPPAQPVLEYLTTGDDHTDLRSVFSWSYRTLSAGAATLFRLLGTHPGPDVSAAAVLSLAGDQVPDVRRSLTELTQAHLVAEPRPDRYALHDLLRAYAAELAAGHPDGTERELAWQRLADHYLQTAHAADRLLHPMRDHTPLPAPVAGVRPEWPADPDAATAWFAAEHAVLLTVVRQARATGRHRPAWQLAWRLVTYLDLRGHWQDWVDVQQVALDAAGQAGQPLWEAHSRRSLALAATWLGRIEEAQTGFAAALQLYRTLGDLPGQAHTQHDRARLASIQGEHQASLELAEQALLLYRAAGHRSGEANTLNAIGWCSLQVGQAEAAVRYCREGLDLLRELGDRKGEASAWDTLGYAEHHLGRHADAVASYRRAIELLAEDGDHYMESQARVHLAECQLGTGNTEAARRSWQRVLEILEALDHPEAEEARAQLSKLG